MYLIVHYNSFQPFWFPRRKPHAILRLYVSVARTGKKNLDSEKMTTKEHKQRHKTRFKTEVICQKFVLRCRVRDNVLILK